VGQTAWVECAPAALGRPRQVQDNRGCKMDRVDSFNDRLVGRAIGGDQVVFRRPAQALPGPRSVRHSPDQARALAPAARSVTRINLAMNWFEELRAKVPSVEASG